MKVVVKYLKLDLWFLFVCINDEDVGKRDGVEFLSKLCEIGVIEIFFLMNLLFFGSRVF